MFYSYGIVIVFIQLYTLSCVGLNDYQDLKKELNQTLWLWRSSDRRLLANLVTTSADRGCRVVSATDSQGC
jgi:hypothetical protein